MGPWAERAFTLLLALAGLGVALRVGLPLPALFGPMLACLLAALLGAPLRAWKPATTASRTVLGVAVGASVTPAIVAELPAMALSLAVIPAYVALIGFVGVPFFRRACGMDRTTSFYAAMPGGATDMVLFGLEAGGDGRALSLTHATRVAVIVALAPILLLAVYGTELDGPLGESAADIPLAEMGLMAAAALAGLLLGRRLHLFGAPILGPLAVTLALSLAGAIHHRPPAEALQVAQFVLGTAISVHYRGVTARELTRTVLAAVAFCAILAALAAAVAEAVVLLGLAPPVEAFLAFAPGGQAEMTVLAIVAGADLGYVVTHHLLRLLVVLTLAPLAARLLR
jgi:hypothetical protein